jgi:3-oxoacid CoA-transferase subunit B
MPTLVAAFVPKGRMVFFHSENGLLGMGAFATEATLDRNLINASRQAVELVPGAAVFRHSESFAMIRGGHIDVAVLGGYQVSSQGDLANWLRPGQQVGGIGGAMDLASGARRLIVLMEHTTRSGEPKIVNRCSYQLTAQRCVNRIVTNLAVIDVTPDGLVLAELAPGITPAQVQAATEPPLIISPDLKAPPES